MPLFPRLFHQCTCIMSTLDHFLGRNTHQYHPLVQSRDEIQERTLLVLRAGHTLLVDRVDHIFLVFRTGHILHHHLLCYLCYLVTWPFVDFVPYQYTDFPCAPFSLLRDRSLHGLRDLGDALGILAADQQLWALGRKLDAEPCLAVCRFLASRTCPFAIRY
jgi:hypothetical protein